MCEENNLNKANAPPACGADAPGQPVAAASRSSRPQSHRQPHYCLGVTGQSEPRPRGV